LVQPALRSHLTDSFQTLSYVNTYKDDMVSERVK